MVAFFDIPLEVLLTFSFEGLVFVILVIFLVDHRAKRFDVNFEKLLKKMKEEGLVEDFKGSTEAVDREMNLKREEKMKKE